MTTLRLFIEANNHFSVSGPLNTSRFASGVLEFSIYISIQISENVSKMCRI
jgi:hypothetical protein